MEEAQIRFTAQMDQASAGSKNLAGLYATYFHTLVDRGFTREEALAIVLEYQRITLVDLRQPPS